MGKKETVVSELCKELSTTRSTLYRYISPNGELRPSSIAVLKGKNRKDKND